MRKSTKSSRSKRSRSRKAKRSLAKAPKRLETLRRKSERAAKRRAAEARDDAAEGRTVWVIFDHGSLPGGTDAMPRRGIVSGPDYVRFDNIV